MGVDAGATAAFSARRQASASPTRLPMISRRRTGRESSLLGLCREAICRPAATDCVHVEARRSARREQGRAHPHIGRRQSFPDDPASSGPLHGPADPGATRCLSHGGSLDAAAYGGSLHSAAYGGSLDGAAYDGSLDGAAYGGSLDGAAYHGSLDGAAHPGTPHGLPDDGPANPGAPPSAAARGPPDDPAKPPASHGPPKSASGHSPSRDALGSAYPANGPAHPPLCNSSSHRHFSPPCEITSDKARLLDARNLLTFGEDGAVRRGDVGRRSSRRAQGTEEILGAAELAGSRGIATYVHWSRSLGTGGCCRVRYPSSVS